MPRVLVAVLVCVVGAMSPGCAVDTKYSQTALNAIETREYDYGFDAVFDESIGAMFDLGYAVNHSDKRGGFLSGAAPRGMVQLKLDQLGPRRTSVRVSTTSGGQTRVDKGRIDEMLDMIDRRLTAARSRGGR